MNLKNISSHCSSWFNRDDTCSGIVISSRLRLARNLASHHFTLRCNQSEKEAILDDIKSALLQTDISGKLKYINIEKASELEVDFLIERYLISRSLAEATGPRAVMLLEDEHFTAMINEEDHLRLQVFEPGLNLFRCWEIADQIDTQLEKNLEYAFSRKYGYLTACPSNVGTGIRVSVMLHLPGLMMTGQIEKFINAARDMGYMVRGLFGEGTKAQGDFYQLSNQVTLGSSEEEIVGVFSEHIVPKIVEYELFARNELLENRSMVLEDKIQRARGILANARMISSKEAMLLLSHLRLGINLNRVKDLSIGTINDLFMLIQPGHIQINSQKPLTVNERDEIRAKLIHEKLSIN